MICCVSLGSWDWLLVFLAACLSLSNEMKTNTGR